MKVVKVKSPTRVDLAGGTLDMWPLYNFVSGALTINVAIDIWTTVELSENLSGGCEISSPDLKKNWSFKNRQEFDAATDAEVIFYQVALKSFPNLTSFRLVTTSQSPVGGGLGGSSSLLISLLRACHEFLGMKLPSVVDLTKLAHHLEAEMLLTPTGTQDYVPAIAGGLNFIESDRTGLHVETVHMEGTPLADWFLLVNTGRTHHSGLNNFDVLRRAVEKDQNVLQALKDIKGVAVEMRADLRKKDFSRFPEYFQRELQARLALTPKFTSPEITRLIELSRTHGAAGLKICGAGGGGCVMIWVDPKHRERLVLECQSAGFQVLNSKPVEPLA